MRPWYKIYRGFMKRGITANCVLCQRKITIWDIITALYGTHQLPGTKNSLERQPLQQRNDRLLARYNKREFLGNKETKQSRKGFF